MMLRSIVTGSAVLIAAVVAPRTNHAVKAFAPTVYIAAAARRRQQHASSSALSMTDLSYEFRKVTFGIEDKDVLKDLASLKKNVAFVDVRDPHEIDEVKCESRPFVRGQYLLNNAALDSRVVSKDFPDKTASIIVFCAKGGRAAKACKNLRDLGYSSVYNAGGIGDLDFLE